MAVRSAPSTVPTSPPQGRPRQGSETDPFAGLSADTATERDRRRRGSPTRKPGSGGPGAPPPADRGGGSGGDGTSPARSPRRPVWLLGLIALLTVAAVVLGVLVLVQRNSGSSSAEARDANLATREQARQDAFDAAVRLAPVMFSYSYKTFDIDEAKQVTATTGDFTAQVKKLLDQGVKPLALRNHAINKGSVLSAAVLDDTNPTEIPVLLFVDQAVQNDVIPAPRLDRYRARLLMKKVGTDWKVEAISLL